MTDGERLREFTFTLEYEPGTDPVADLLRDRPALGASTVDLNVGGDAYVRLVQLTGPPEATDRLQTLLEERAYRPRALDERSCAGTSSHYRLECAPRRRLVYAYVEEVRACASVHSIAASALCCGTIVESRARDGREHWRLLVRSDEAVGDVYERIDDACRDGVRVDVGHLCDATTWTADGIVDADVTGTQQQAIAEAAARGYYERPRKITIEELADELDVPESTLSYRLRRAESTLVKQYLNQFGTSADAGDVPLA